MGTHENHPPSAALHRALFQAVVTRPGLAMVVCLAVIAAFGAGLTRLVKDPSVDAFVSSDHPAAQARDRAREIFDVEDPLLVALISDDSSSVFTPERLEALYRLSERLETLDEVKSNGVTSLATESALRGENGDLFVDPILDAPPYSSNDAQTAWTRVQSMPPFMGVLAAPGGYGAMIVVTVEDPDHAGAVYRSVLEITEDIKIDGVGVHVAGVAAMNARLAEMVDGDTRIFVPAAVFVVLLVVLAAVRRVIGLIGPLLVIAGSAAIGIGLMGWMDARYYLITTALPVVIMAIAVADSLHIALCYQRARRDAAELTAKDAALIALTDTWRPVTLTSLTTVAGFAGLALGSSMTPVREFGAFAAVGVIAAWGLSLTLLPAILVLTDLKSGRDTGRRLALAIDGAVARISALAVHNPGVTVVALALVGVLLTLAGSLVDYDYERKRYFQPSDAVRIGDQTINDRFAGANVLDVVVSTADEGGLMTSQAIAAMADLQNRLERAPFVTKVTGISDYIALMHQRLTNAPPGAVPERANAAAQYMFLYEASADPEDFKEEIDFQHQTALIRAHLDRDDFIETSETVDAFSATLAEWSAETGFSAEVSGRIAVNHGWMSQLQRSHPTGLMYALIFVFIASAAVFMDLRPALVVMAPVAAGVAAVYAVMGVADIDLAPATSMCAAISTGLGVDFGIHLVNHIMRRTAAGARPEDAVAGGYLVVARACVFSALALAIGLSIVALSAVPALQWFGGLIAVGAVGALAGALAIAPAAAWLLKPYRARELQNA